MNAASLARHASPRQTPQSQPIPGRTDMSANNAGGFGFQVDCWEAMRRLLILGSTGGTYYVSEQQLTADALGAVRQCADTDPARTVRLLLEVDEGGLAPKKTPALLVAALLSSHAQAKHLLLPELHRICRTGGHLLEFVAAAEQFRGWGTTLRRGVQSWFTGKDERELGYQLSKYQQREGWAMRDVLRLAHPKFADQGRNLIARWAVGKLKEEWDVSIQHIADTAENGKTFLHSGASGQDRLCAMLATRKVSTAEGYIRLIHQFNLVREQLPTEALQHAAVWEALLQKMPLHALVRNLGAMTARGVIAPFSDAAKKIEAKLADAEYIHRSRLHPLPLLLALTTYQQGHGVKGKLSWQPVNTLTEALEEAYYLSFHNVPPTGLRYLVGLDVSGSMSSPCLGSLLKCCEGATAMAMLIARTEKLHQLMAFDQGFRSLGITARTGLADALKRTTNINGGGTDCSLPFLYALQHQLPVDCFVTITDNETWAGAQHPCQALQLYRQKMGINARSVVMSMVANSRTIADPNDPGMLDTVGFDASVPQIIRNFALGWQPAKFEQEEEVSEE